MSVVRIASFSAVSALASLAAFICLPFVASALSIEEFARFSLAYSVIGVVGSALLIGAPALYMANWASGRAGVSRYFYSWSARFFIVGLPLAWVTVVSFELWVGWFLVLCVAIFKSLYMFFLCHFRLKRDIWSFSRYQIITILGVYVPPVLLSLYVDVTALVFFAAMLLSYLGAFLFFYFSQGVVFSLFEMDHGQYFRYSAFAFLHSLVASLLTVFDRFVVSSFVSGAALAEYMLAAMLVAIIPLAGSLINQNMMPIVYGCMDKGKGVLRIFGIYFLIVSVGVVFFNLGLRWVIEIFYPPNFAESIGIARVLCVGAFFQCLYFFASSLLAYYKRSDWIFFATLGVGSIGGVSSVILVSHTGVPGALVAHAVTWVVYFFVICGFVYGSHYKAAKAR